MKLSDTDFLKKPLTKSEKWLYYYSKDGAIRIKIKILRNKQREGCSKNYIKMGVFIIYFIFSFLAPPTTLRAGWNIPTVDSSGDVGYVSAIIVDSSGFPHIAYHDSTNLDVKYARWTGSSWNIQTIDSAGSVGHHISIAVDPNNNLPSFTYYNNDTQDIKYARWNGSSWDISFVDSTGDAGKDNSLAMDSNGYPHISYWEGLNRDLKYAKWNGSSWNIQTVESTGWTGHCTSLALDSNNYAHISYRNLDYADLKYAKWNGSSWNIQTIDSTGDLGHYTSVKIDTSGYPHIAYHDDTNMNLKYAMWNGTSWNIQTVDSGDVSHYISLDLDSNDYPHIVYEDSVNKTLKYAKWDGGSWNISTIDSSNNTGYVSLDIDSNGYSHISYYDSGNNDLKYARYVPDLCTISGKVTRSDGTTVLFGTKVEVLQAGEIKATTYAVATGTYSISVSSGTYDVRASSTGYLPQTQTGKTVASGQSVTVDFTLSVDPSTLGTISGRVTLPDDLTPVIGASVHILQSGTTVQTLLTASDGTYSAPNLNPDIYSVTAWATGYKSSSTANVQVSANQTTTVNFSLEMDPASYGRISGKVTRTDGLTAIPDALIRAVISGTETLISTVTTTLSGNYEIILPTTNVYDVRASAYGYYTSTQTNISIYSGQTTTINFQLAFIDTNQPYPVGDLIATPVHQSKIRLDWTASPSTDVTYYRIYYSTTGTINYAVIRDTVTSASLSWTSPSLTLGIEYTFSVRPVNSSGIENLDTNMIAKAIPTLDLYTVKAVIKIPKTGMKVTGNHMTVFAEIIQGLYVNYVRFEYKPSDSHSWKFIPALLSTKFPNPDSTPPYFIHWDVSGLSNGNYDLRAVAFDIFGGYDPEPLSITITIDHVNPDSEEKLTADGGIQKTESIYNSKNNTVKIGLDDTNNLTEIMVPSGSLDTFLAKLDIVTDPVNAPSTPERFSKLSKIHRIELDNNQKELSNNKEATISIPYIQEKVAGKTNQIRPYRYDETEQKWKAYAGDKFTVDSTNKKVTFNTAHFSYFGIFAGAANDLSKAHPYPNPFVPSRGHTKITFTELTEHVRIRIFNAAGELVFDEEKDTPSGERTDYKGTNNAGEELASGIYFYLITDNKGSVPKKGKLAIIR